MAAEESKGVMCLGDISTPSRQDRINRARPEQEPEVKLIRREASSKSSPGTQAMKHHCRSRSHSSAMGLLQGLLSVVLFNLIFIQTTSCWAQQIYRRQQPRQSQPLPPVQPSPPQDNVVAEMQVFCHSDSIVLMVNTNTPFNGMLYAKDAANGPNCLSEFHSSTNMTFRLPLKSCGTLSAEVDDGVEFFNTIVVQPHMRLMTNQGKGYHIRCKYQTRERTIANTHFNVSAAFLMQNGPQSSTAPLLATASMPMCTMKIYRIDQDNVAESVKVGDKLVMVIEIDRQDMYGMRITNCVVRDGMNKAEQQLINDSGCPVDETIMPKFEYENNNTRAAVAFRAHKFPHTSSIYYQCNVRLCINGGGCDPVVCPSGVYNESSSGPSSSSSSSLSPSSSASSGGGPRRKRFIGKHGGGDTPELAGESAELPLPSELKSPAEMSFDVYSGLYVSDVDMGESNSGDPNGQQVMPAGRSNARDSAEASANSTTGGGGGGGGGESSDGQQEACLTMTKAGLLVVAASLSSVGLVLLVACQAGLLSAGADERNLAGELALDLEHHRQSHLQAQHQHHLHVQQQQQQHKSSRNRHRMSRSPKRHADSGRGVFQVPNYTSARLLSGSGSSSASTAGGKSLSPFYPLA